MNIYRKRLKTVLVHGRRTTIRLEQAYWEAVRDITAREECTLSDLIQMINDSKEKDQSLTEALRSYVLLYFRFAATEEGHARCGHGRILRKWMNVLRKKGETNNACEH